MLRIGISSCFFHEDYKRAVFKGKTLLYLEQSLGQWVLSYGALAYPIPTLPTNSPLKLKDFVNDLDGFVLQGGSDVSPQSYGEVALRPEWSGDFIRDQYEIALLKEFMAQKKPVLGVCRGLQLINVAFGGTLYQDITTQIPGSLEHRNWDIYDQNFHQISWEKESRLQTLYPQKNSAKVNSVHHQAVKDLGKNLKIEAKAIPDGVIEALRGTEDSYLFAVQWHPEFQDPKDNSLLPTQPILEDFFNAVEKYKRKTHA